MDFTGVTRITKSTVVVDFGQARQLCHRIIFCNIQARRLCWLPYPCGGPANYVRKVRVIFCVSAYLDTYNPLFKSPQKLDIFNGHRILSLVQEANTTSLMEHSFSQPTECRFFQRIWCESNSFLMITAVTWVSWVKNRQNLISKVIFLCQKSFLSFWFFSVQNFGLGKQLLLIIFQFLK